MRSLAALVAAIVAGAALVTQPLLLRATSHLPFELRDPVFISWVLAWDARHLPHRLLSVWDAPALYPYDATLTFSEHFFGVAVFVAPIVWLTDNPVLAYNGALAGSYVLAGVGLFVLARELSLSTAAACAAAMIYAFGPFRYAQLAHLQNLMTGWMPLVLAGLHAYVMRGSRRGLAGAVAAFLLLSASNLYYMLIFGVLVGPLLIAVLVAAPDRRVALRHLALAAAAFVAIYGPVLKLYADVHERYALARDRDLNVRLSADVASYLSQPAEIEAQQGLPLPGFAQPGGPLEVHDGRLFPGFLMIGFAAVGLVAGRGSPVVWVSAAATLTGLLLSLGPSPAIWGHPVGISGPYDVLFRFVPGFDGIRVPARFSVLVHLGLAVLAAYGIDRLIHRVGGGRRWWLAGTLGAAAVLLSYPGGTVLAEVGPNGRERDSGLSNWLARQPHGAVLELPIGGFDRNYRGFLYHYRTLRHPHPLVNGWSGYQTDVQLLLGGPASPLHQVEGMPSLLELSRGLGVRYLVVHPQDYPDPALGRSHLEAVTAAPGQWRDRVHFGDATAFVLEPFQTQPLPTGRAVPPARITARAYTAPDRVGALFDGLLYSRWTSGPQSGGEWIDLRFSTPVDVAGLRFDVHARSLPHYPQQLTITADPAGAQTVLFSGSILSGLGQSLVRDPTRPQYSVALPPNRATVLRIAQTARAVREPFWAIDELVVLERE